MEKRLLLTMVLSIGVLILFNYFYYRNIPKPPQVSRKYKESAELKEAKKVTEVKEIRKAEEVKKPEVKKDTVKRISGEEITLETNDVVVKFNTRGAVIKSWVLKKYQEARSNVDLVWQNEDAIKPLTLEIPSKNFTDDIIYICSIKNLTAEFTGELKNNIKITKVYKFSKDGFKVSCEINIVSREKGVVRDAKVFVGTGIHNHSPRSLEEKVKKEEIGHVFEKLRTITNITYINEKVLNNKPKNYDEEEMINKGALSWIGIKDKYFISVFIVNPEEKYNGINKKVQFKLASEEVDNEGKNLTYKYDMPVSGLILPEFSGEDGKTFSFSIYSGPLLLDNLNALNVHLHKALDFGWFSWIGIWMLVTLKFLYKIFNNYGIAIVFLTIIVKAILWLPTQSSYRSMKKMQELNPHIQAIREKYKSNMAKMNEEMMKLYKEKKINPLGGCLPLILQIPIFFALYMILINAIELKGASFIFWIKDLSVKDPYYILAILMGVTMLIQQKMTPSTDPQQAKIMLFLPILFTFLFASLPAGVLLYWVVQNILSIVQQYFVNKAVPNPN